LRPGGVAVITESVVLAPEDRRIPSALVRLSDPSHPAFLTADEIVDLCERAGFSHVEATIVPYRDRWFRKWLAAEQARADVAQEAWELYRHAPESFVARHNVVMADGDITSTVPWLFVRAIKS
jgi:hypothetical protein